jgi:hypothetical protein
MKHVLFLILGAASVLGAQEKPSEVNVNEKYRISRVDLVPARHYRLSPPLAGEIRRLVGENFSQEKVDRLARRIKAELGAHAVRQRVVKGDEPETVKVAFEVERWGKSISLTAGDAGYHSKQGWSGAVNVTQTIGATRFGAGLVSNGDERVERYAGFEARFERLSLGTDRAQLKFEFGSYHEQWNPATLEALQRRPALPGIYRTRQSFAPTLTVKIAPYLNWTAGVDFERFQTQFPAAHTEAANAVTSTLRIDERWERPRARHVLGAGYSLRAATRQLDSDFAYTRHAWDARYSYEFGRQRVVAGFFAGELRGRAPLFERFIAGNSQFLRGWNRWDLAPLGGDRMAHGKLEYQYDCLRVFYDTGSVWDRGGQPVARHSLGLGLQLDHHFWKQPSDRGYRKGLLLAMAFPVKDGRAEPVFIIGLDF